MIIDTSQMTENKPYPVAFTESYQIPECFCLADNQVTVHAEGNIDKNRTTVVFSGLIKFCLKLNCDLCLKPLDYHSETTVTLTFSHLPKGDNSDILPVIGGKIEIDLLPELLLNLPMKVLCSETCKGICDTCGCDLNFVNCTCNTK